MDSLYSIEYHDTTLADGGGSGGLYRGADGGGYVGRVRRIGGIEKRDGCEGRPLSFK